MNFVQKLMLGLTVATLLFASQRSFAYEEDTHFLLTYVICRSAGFTDAEALTVAAVDQGMDDSSHTVANGGTGGVIPNVPQESRWHALDKDGKMGPKGIIKRKDELFSIALKRATPEEKLIYLGVFYHYQQDTWAHRHHYDGDVHSYDSYTTYNTPFGHARHGHQPDRPPFDPVTAVLNLEDGIGYATRFLKEGLGRQPNAFLANYRPTGGKQDDGWNDNRKGKYFHQLAISGAPGSATRYLADLIRAQVNAYTSSIDANPFFLGRYTANELAFDKARSAFQAVCTGAKSSLGEEITIPSHQDKVKQGFTGITEQQISAALPN